MENSSFCHMSIRILRTLRTLERRKVKFEISMGDRPEIKGARTGQLHVQTKQQTPSHLALNPKHNDPIQTLPQNPKPAIINSNEIAIQQQILSLDCSVAGGLVFSLFHLLRNYDFAAEYSR